MAKPHLLLVNSLILNQAMAVGCSTNFVDRASTSTQEVYTAPGDQRILLFREEAEELRAAAHAQQASVQATEADRYAEEYHRQ